MNKPPSLSRLLPLYVVIFFGFVGYSMMITLFTPLFMYAQGGMISNDSSLESRVIILGVVLALFPLAQFFGSPFLGALSDRYGRKPILMISLYIAPVCYAFIALSLMMGSLTLLMISSLIAGLSQANIVIAQSAIADVSHSKDRNRLFGYIYLSASTAYVIGPLMGGKLTDPSIFAWFNYATPFWVVCALLAITLIWTHFAFSETKKHKEKNISLTAAFANLLTVFTSRKLRVIYLINFLLYFAIFGFFRCYPMFIVDAFKVNASQLSEFIAWVSVPIILVNLGVTGKLSKHYSPRTLTFFSALLTGLFMLIIIFPSSSNALWITLFLTSAALALALPSTATMLSLEASSTEQGRVMGNNQSLQVAAEALSAFAGGLIASISVDMSLIVLAFIAWLAALILITKRGDGGLRGLQGL
jgi:DHA1 family tetracycline resistance protein-like MFS transporter